MNQLVQNTLSAWALIETLQPGEVEGIDDYLSETMFEQREKQKVMRKFETFEPLWEADKFKLSEPQAVKAQLQFQMYRHCFRFAEIEKELQQMFDEEEVYNESSKICYGYTFMVDNQGKVLLDTLYVPMLMSAMKNMTKNPNEQIETVYEDHFERFKHECDEILGDNVLTEVKLNHMDRVYEQYFARYETRFSGFFKHATAVRVVKPGDQMNELNSFYLSDIEQAKQAPSTTLTHYIEGVADMDKIEIDENREGIEAILQPKYYPDGRWPSLVEHRLSLMQQVAVNQITSGHQHVSSVNGPPGTGKTTLLKDIFAHNIVERAKVLAELSSPRKAFEARKIHETDARKMYFFKGLLAQFKMVVASSNNGAVENITKDLPKIAEVIRQGEDSSFMEYELAYQKEASKLKDFSKIAENIIEEPAWGLFSAAMGKRINIDVAIKHALKDNSNNLVQLLKEQEKEMDVSRSWEEAQNNFKETLDKIKQLKADIEKGIQLNHSYQDAIATSKQLQAKKAHHQQLLEQIDAETAQNKTHLEETENELQENKMEQELLNHTLSQEKSNKSALDKLVGFFKGDTNQDSKNPDLSERVTKLIDDRDSLKQKQKTFKQQAIELEKQKQNSTSNIAQIKKQEQAQEDAIQQYETFKAQHSSVQFSDDAFWAKENYKVRQEKVLNTSDELQFYRGLLFIQAMVLHKLVLLGNVKSVQAGLWDFERRYEYIKDKPEKVQNAWNVLHLVYPVISTTFASFRNMYRDMPKDFIDYLYIDEAGQAVPQAAVGAMQRARQVVAVGDPIQIEPVVTLDNHLIDLVRKAYQVPERLVSAEASVQSIADNANVFGYWKGTDSGNPTWIGIPLWVHRRCLNPMFDISNIIAYEEKMVLPDYIKKKPGQASWLDIKGKAGPKQFVKEQGEAVVNCLLKDWKKALQNGESAPSTYVISPFTKVKDEIRKSVRNALQIEINLDRKAASEWAKKSIGTVHTFQGKEADKVYFVTGTDDTQNGAIKWSCQKPNLINVAVTRAKKEFVIIGDKERISKLENYEIIAEHVN